MTLSTEVIIDASPVRIWDVLTDFTKYPEWNLAIPEVQGRLESGALLGVTIQWPGLRKSRYQLKVLCADPYHELRWLGHFGLKRIMDGDHAFVIEPIAEGRTRVTQVEHFSGCLVPLFVPWLKRNVLAGFEQMNRDLKIRAENT